MLFYWKNPQGEEFDFVVQRGLQVSELIQVCVSMHRTMPHGSGR